MTRVVNCKKESFDIYIGRHPNPIIGKWGNPYTHIDKDTLAQFVVKSREEAIEKYREYILNKPELLNCLDELENKTLGCWCKPDSCHGDVLLELLTNRNLLKLKNNE